MADLLCAACLRLAFDPTANLTGVARGDVAENKRTEIRPHELGRGWDDVRFASHQSLGWTAVTTIQGTAVCWAHVAAVDGCGQLVPLWPGHRG